GIPPRHRSLNREALLGELRRQHDLVREAGGRRRRTTWHSRNDARRSQLPGAAEGPVRNRCPEDQRWINGRREAFLLSGQVGVRPNRGLPVSAADELWL